MRKVLFILLILFTIIYLKPLIVQANGGCVPVGKPEIVAPAEINYEIGQEKPNWLNYVSSIDSCNQAVKITFDDSDVVLTEEGIYKIHFYSKGSLLTIEVKVVEDMTKPIISGAIDFTIEVNSSDVDFKRDVTVSDNKDLEIENKLIIDTKAVDTTKVGEYPLKYEATDYKGNHTSVTVTVKVVDTIYPIIENAKNRELEVKKDLKSFDWWSGISVSDNSNVFDKRIDFGKFDINRIGIYDVIYIVTDGVGNTTKKTIKVSVVDKVKPEIILNQKLKFKIGEIIDWKKGLTVTDNYENISVDMVICDISNVNLNVPGTYKILYFVSDSSGNYNLLETEVTIYDINFPKIHNVKDLEIEVNSEYNFRQGITAFDDEDGDLTEQIIVYDQNVDLNKVGIYKLFYIVMDKSGNKTIETIDVKVYDDVAPVIEGIKDLIIEVFNTTFDFLKDVKAYDNLDGEIFVDVNIEEVDFTKLGEYVITYSTIDSNNNKTIEKVKVTIVDRTKPILSGYKDITIKVGTAFNPLANIKAIDNYDGDITNSIQLIGTYDIHKAGEYQIKIEVSDSSGNYTSGYFKIIVEDELSLQGVDPKTMYYIAGTVGATILIFGFISYLNRKRIKKR